MKKLFVTLLIVPFLFGCKNKKNNVVPAEQYIKVSVEELSLMEDDTYQINTEIVKSGTIVFYSSADESIATVSESGLISAIKQGETSITIRGGKDTYTIFLEVLPYQAKDSLQIVLPKDSYVLAVNDTYTLPLEIKVGNAPVNDVVPSFSFENENIASIDEDFLITAKAIGSTKCLIAASYQQQVVNKSFTVIVY